MNSKTPLLIATAIAASLSIAAFTPAAFADQGKGYGQGQGGMHRGDRMEQREGRGQGRGGLLGLACSDQGAARIEAVLDGMGNRMTLTDEQKSLFDDFKTHALTAQTTYADGCVAPTRDGSGDLVTRLEHQKSNMTAMVAAMDEVLPSLEAFHNSLTDEQKATLKQKRGMQGERGERHGWRRNN